MLKPDLELATRMVASPPLQAAKRAVQRQVLVNGAKWSSLSRREVRDLAAAYCEAGRGAVGKGRGAVDK
jgi:hypothetical protein